MPGKAIVVKWIIWTVFLLPALAYPKGSAGQRLHFKHLTVEDGLASSNALTITQDDKGFLWVGTNDGLSRYDGGSVKVFRDFYKDNPVGANLKILSLVSDENHQLWIGTSNGLYLYNAQKDTFTAFFHSPSDNRSICNNVINRVFKDRQGGIWLCTEAGLCKVMVWGSSYRFVPVSLDVDGFSTAVNVYALSDAGNGMMLAGTDNGAIVFSNANPGGTARPLQRILPGMRVISLEMDKRRNFWAGTNSNGVIRIDQTFKTIKHYREDNTSDGILGNVIWKVCADRLGRIWIGTSKGLNIYYPEEGRMESFVNDPEDEHSLNSDFILDIFEDRDGSVWLGTFFGGLNYVDAVTTPFYVHRSHPREQGISSNLVSAIVEDKQGNLWIGNDGEGVDYYDRKKQVFKNYRDQMPFAALERGNRVTSLLLDNAGNLWEGSFGGVNVFDVNGRKKMEFWREGEKRLRSRNVLCLMQDHTDRVWIGTQLGIHIYDGQKGTKRFETLYDGKETSDKEISCLLEDSKKNIWIGTRQGLGLLRSAGNRRVSFYQTKSADSLPSDYISCIAEDAKGIIWIGTYAGLTSYDPVKNRFRTYTVKDGLSGNKVVGVVADDRNNLWISTDQGISRLDASRKYFNVFNVHDGLPGNVFYYRSFFKDSKGHIFFGSYNGLVEFVPSDIETNRYAPKVVLTGLRIDGKEVKANDSTRILSSNIADVSELILKYNQNVVVVDYAVMNFIKPEKNRSAYKLIGYDKDWVPAEGHRASFTNIPEGNYSLLIKGANNDGYWSEPYVLKLTVLPPPWKTWWAYALYTLGISLAISGVVYFFAAKAAFRRKLRYVEMVNQKQQELHQMKMDFFTHISHEIRTPLTLIFLPLEALMDTFEADGQVVKMLTKIKVNAERLLTLTNDLLEFRKADSGYTQLKVSEANIAAFAEMVYEKFSTIAVREAVGYHFKSEEPQILAYFDAHHLEIVLSNLLSNAFKFTREGGHVSVEVGYGGDETVEIRVRDNGIGIPQENQDQIFTNFYQANAGGIKNTGSGIGLAFSKSLVDLHKGKLTFQSGVDPDTGRQQTQFIIALKLGKDHFKENFLIAE